VKENDQKEIERYHQVLNKILISYGSIQLGASREDAEDCAQNVLIHSVVQIRKGNLQHAEAIISYLFTSFRNEYLKLKRKLREPLTEQDPQEIPDEPRQLSQMIEVERLHILEQCMKLLKEDLRTFIGEWFLHPGKDAAAVADQYGMSVTSVWTKKHRIIQVLKECVHNKWKK
ncbi:MAG: sigma-70 family RNA polymerase sigma factor, partial [Bacteroidota bacterium]